MKLEARLHPAVAVLIGGGIAAVLDIVYAVLRNVGYGRSALWTLQSVASGWLGKAAFDSGIAGGVLGFASHFAILFIAAALFIVATQSFALLRSKTLVCGAIFGVLVYLFMNFVVLPLSAFPFKLTYPPLRLLEGFASHAVFVGLPIAWAAKRIFTENDSDTSKRTL